MLVVETVFDGTNMVQRHRVKNTETWHCPDERHIQWLDEDLYTTELVFSYFYFFTCSWAIDWNPLANRWLALCDDYSLNGLFHICQICPDAAFQNTILKRRVIEPQNKVPVFFFLSMKLHDLSAQIFSQDFEMKPVRIYRKTTDSYE